MRGGDHVVELEQLPVRGRLLGEDVEGCAGNLATGQRFVECFFIDDPAAGTVDDADAVLHLGELFCADHIGGFFGLGQMQGDVIGLGQKLVQCDQFGAVLGGHKRIIGQDFHTQGDSTHGDRVANIAVADDAQGFAADLIAGEGLLVPFFGFHRGGCFVEVARQHEHIAKGQLSHRQAVGERGIHDCNTPGAGVLVIDRIQAGAAAHDHLEVGADIDQRLADLGPRANDHAVVGGQNIGKFFGGNIIAHIHGQARGAHLFDIFLLGLVTNQDFHFFVSLLRY